MFYHNWYSYFQTIKEEVHNEMKICLEKISSIVNGNLSFSESNQVGHFVRNMDEVSIF